MKQYKYKTLDKIFDYGSYTFKAKTAIRAILAPAFVGILSGLDQEGSGVQNNTWSDPWINEKIYKP